MNPSQGIKRKETEVIIFPQPCRSLLLRCSIRKWVWLVVGRRSTITISGKSERLAWSKEWISLLVQFQFIRGEWRERSSNWKSYKKMKLEIVFMCFLLAAMGTELSNKHAEHARSSDLSKYDGILYCQSSCSESWLSGISLKTKSLWMRVEFIFFVVLFALSIIFNWESKYCSTDSNLGLRPGLENNQS